MVNANLGVRASTRLALCVTLCLSALLVPVVLAACANGGGSENSGTPFARSGEVVFQRYCNVCHPGGNMGAGPSLILALPRLSDEEVRDYVRHGKTRMPGFSTNEISDQELNDLLVYIRSLK